MKASKQTQDDSLAALRTDLVAVCAKTGHVWNYGIKTVGDHIEHDMTVQVCAACKTTQPTTV